MFELVKMGRIESKNSETIVHMCNVDDQTIMFINTSHRCQNINGEKIINDRCVSNTKVQNRIKRFTFGSKISLYQL